MSDATIEDSAVALTGTKGPAHPNDFGLVQLFDLAWVFDPGYQRLLDNLAASPGAVTTVRVMKVFTNGIATTQVNPPRPALLPNEIGINPTTMGGNVWPAGGVIDLSGTLNGLYEFTRRKLFPFVVLGFFPDGIYSGISQAPMGDPTCSTLGFSGTSDPAWQTILGNWKTLVKAFFDGLFGDARFNKNDIASNWRFEVWNEPDIYFFWGPDFGNAGTLAFYQSLYLATSEVVVANRYKVQLGGPVVTDSSGTQTLENFISFLKTKDPETNSLPKCDFLSFHGKGEWDSCLNAQPVLPVGIAEQAAQWAQKSPALTSIKIVNDEADMRANFAAPFFPRMTQQYPAWLAAQMIAYDYLGSQYPFEFVAGSDNAELPLTGYLEQSYQASSKVPVQSTTTFQPAAFGQQRSIMTGASAKMNGTTWNDTNCPIDLLKVPVYNFYELLRLLGDQHGTVVTGSNNYYPHTDLFHMITVAATHIGSIFCVYPGPFTGSPVSPGRIASFTWQLDYSIQNLPASWAKINWYQFQIDESASNGYAQVVNQATPLPNFCLPTALSNFPKTSITLPLSATSVRNIRQHQELAVVNHAVNVAGGTFKTQFTIPAHATAVFWITEYTATPPTAPNWATPTSYALDVTDYGTNVVLFWKPDTDATFYSYQVFRDNSPTPISPMPLRSALWVDTNPGSGTHTYYVKTLSASGFPSPPSTTLSVTVS